MTAARQVIRWLLALYPPHFRAQYGDDMRDAFLDQMADARRRGRLAALRQVLRLTWLMSLAAWRERRQDRRGAPGQTFEAITSDLRLTGRALIRSPLASITTIIVIAIGIGGVTTIASAMNALVLRPLPGTTDGRSLYTIERRSEDHSEGVSVSVDLYRHLRESTQSLSGLAVWSRVTLSMRIEAASLSVPGNIVSTDYFDVLGLTPAAGRFFFADEVPDTVVISHRLWRAQFQERRDVVGRAVTLNGRPYTVIGVAPDGFRGVFTPLRIDAWVPLAAQPHVRPGRDLTSSPWLWMFGRLAPGITPEQSRAELTTRLSAWIGSTMREPYRRYASVRFTPLTGLPDDARRGIFWFSGLLLAAAVVVLLIAGANVSSLLAARAHSRRHEMGIRTALGGSRRRLAGQLLAETVVLFVLGSCGGLLLATAGTTLLEGVRIPGDVGLHLELSPDWRVALAAAGLGLAAGIGFGLGPALRGATVNPSMLLRASTAGSGTRRSRLTSALIVVQLAGSLVLVSVTTLLSGAVSRGERISLGFRTDGISTAVLNTESWGYDETRARAFFDALDRHLREQPSIGHVAFAQLAPLVSTPSGGTITVTRGDERERVAIESTIVGPRFFETLGIPVVAGRAFDDSDGAMGPAMAVVSDTFAKQVFPDELDVVGRTFDMGDSRVTIAGVVGDAKWGEIDEPPVPLVYLAVDQRWPSSQTLFVTSADSAGAARAVIEAVRHIDPLVPAPTVSTLAADISIALFPQRVAAVVTSALGAGALVLSAAGLYGVLALVVSAQRREIGVRMALGATRAQVIGLVLRRGLRLAAAGIIIGLAGSVLVAPLTADLLLGGAALDARAFGVSAVVLTLVTLAAALVPARRAATVDPVQALR